MAGSNQEVRPAPDLGVRVIVAYKLTKGAVQLALAVALFVAIERGVASEWLHDVVSFFRHHLASAASLRVAGLLLQLATPRRLGLTALALALDGALTTGEGVALHRRHWWGPWLVVVASGSLLPYEIYELVRVPRLGRVLLVVVNALIVAYLARRAIREHEARVSKASS